MAPLGAGSPESGPSAPPGNPPSAPPGEDREPPNRQLLHRWRLALPLSKLLQQSPPEEMEALALKARFSQHTITRQELKKLTHWQAGLTSALRKAPWWKRLYARWIRILT